jgi:ribosome biogenesis GTPase / thiamine phosphate phosphatase
MTTLEKYGWNGYFEQHFLQRQNADFIPARVVSVKGFKYHLVTESGELEAELSGKLLFASENEEIPKTGDWVYCLQYDTNGYITEVFPRKNRLERKNPGAASEVQVLAANIDKALIVQGLDQNFNLMRLDRYMVQIIANGITPVVVLNKADLVQDKEHFRNEVSRLGKDCEVHFCSTFDGSGIKELADNVLLPSLTCILVGSSGVGKSSLLNALSAGVSRKTGTLSESTQKGKHVTTTRDLFRLPTGCMIIDTPGMREFGVTFDENLHDSGLFPLIDNYAVQCRYHDCSHTGESGCAVVAAYESGELDPAVYNSYLKLTKEQKRFNIQAGEKKRMGKQMGQMMREVKDFKKRELDF